MVVRFPFTVKNIFTLSPVLHPQHKQNKIKSSVVRSGPRGEPAAAHNAGLHAGVRGAGAHARPRLR